MATDIRQRLPNAITLARLVLAVGFFAALNAYRYPDVNVLWGNVAIVLFALAAITDALDGYLARKWQATTTFGRIMDPFCDKFLVIGAYIFLAGPRFVAPEWAPAPESPPNAGPDAFFTMSTGVYPWMVILIFGRELLVTGVRGVVESMGIDFGAKWAGKAKMILQSVAIPVVIFLVVNVKTAAPGNAWAMWVCHVLVYATVIVTVWSGVPYVLGLREVLRRSGREAATEPRASVQHEADGGLEPLTEFDTTPNADRPEGSES